MFSRTVFIINDVFSDFAFMMVEGEDEGNNGVYMLESQKNLNTEEVKDFLGDLDIDIEDCKVVVTHRNIKGTLTIAELERSN